jgi:hypothetical protein
MSTETSTPRLRPHFTPEPGRWIKAYLAHPYLIADTAFESVTHPNSVTGQAGLLGLDNLFGITDSNDFGASGKISLFRVARCGFSCF